MPSLLNKIDIDLFNHTINETIEFRSGLNIISGANGTFKSTILDSIKIALDPSPHQHSNSSAVSGNAINVRGGTLTPYFNSSHDSIKVLLISPKRNSERRSYEQILESVRGGQAENAIRQIVERVAGNDSYVAYPSFSELFMMDFEKRRRMGGDQVEYMTESILKYNGIISRVFGEYEVSGEWDESSGVPRMNIKKYQVNLPIDGFSLGEKEVLALAAFVENSVPDYDLILIDEPEVHLHWHLENKMLDFLWDVAHVGETQIIAVTHSRAVFNEKYLPLTTFLKWSDGEVKADENPDEDIIGQLSGEAIEIIKMAGDFVKPTFFVEDNAHEQFVRAISRKMDIDISISKCGNSSNVKSIFRLSKEELWSNAYFVVDGDNQGNPYPGEDKFIHLNKYCIDNYLLNIGIAANISGKSESDVEEAMMESIKSKGHKLFGQKAAGLVFLLEDLDPQRLNEDFMDSVDASSYISEYINKLDLEYNLFVGKYIDEVFDGERQDELLPGEILQALAGSQAVAD